MAETIFMYWLQEASVAFGRRAIPYPLKVLFKEVANIVEGEALYSSIFRICLTFLTTGLVVGLLDETKPKAIPLDGVFHSEPITLLLIGLLAASLGAFAGKQITRGVTFLYTRNGVDEKIYIPVARITNPRYLIPKKEALAIFNAMQAQQIIIAQSPAALELIIQKLLQQIRSPLDPELRSIAKATLSAIRKKTHHGFIQYGIYLARHDLILSQQESAIDRVLLEANTHQFPRAQITPQNRSLLRRLTTNSSTDGDALEQTLHRPADPQVRLQRLHQLQAQVRQHRAPVIRPAEEAPAIVVHLHSHA